MTDLFGLHDFFESSDPLTVVRIGWKTSRRRPFLDKLRCVLLQPRRSLSICKNEEEEDEEKQLGQRKDSVLVGGLESRLGICGVHGGNHVDVTAAIIIVVVVVVIASCCYGILRYKPACPVQSSRIPIANRIVGFDGGEGTLV